GPLPGYTRASMLHEADQLRQMGNVVRSALHRFRVGETEDARADLKTLAHRLEDAVPGGHEEVMDWFEALKPLLPPAADQYWSVEARLLYELQKACIEHERKLYSTDAIEWALWYGRRRMLRPLPLAQMVSQIRDLRKARHLLDAARVNPAHR